MAEQEKSAIGSIVGTIILAAVCVAGGWIAKDMWPKGNGSDAAAQAAKLAAMAAMQQTVAVTNAEMRVYSHPERFVAHAEAVQEVDLGRLDGLNHGLRNQLDLVVDARQMLRGIKQQRGTRS